MPVTHAKNVTIADWSGVVTVANSTGGTTTDQASNLARPTDWNSNHAVNLSASEVAPIFSFANGLSSTTAAGGITVGIQSDPWFSPFLYLNTGVTQRSMSSMSNGTWYLDGPFEVDQCLDSGQINVYMAMPANFLGGAVYSAASTGSVTRTATFYNHWALYKQGTGASTSRLESFWTAQNSWIITNEMNLSTANTSSGTLTNRLTISWPAQFNDTGGVTYSSTSTSATSNLSTSTMASTRYDSLISNVGAFLSGSIMQIFGLSTRVVPGAYWVGRMQFTTTSSAGTSGGVGSMGTYYGQCSVLGQVELLGNAFKRQGLSVTNSTSNFFPYHGFLATSTTNATSIINTSDIRGTTGQLVWNYFKSTY